MFRSASTKEWISQDEIRLGLFEDSEEGRGWRSGSGTCEMQMDDDNGTVEEFFHDQVKYRGRLDNRKHPLRTYEARPQAAAKVRGRYLCYGQMVLGMFSSEGTRYRNVFHCQICMARTFEYLLVRTRVRVRDTRCPNIVLYWKGGDRIVSKL